HTRWPRDWSSDVCSSDLTASRAAAAPEGAHAAAAAREAVRRSGRTVTGFSGPWHQVVAARAALGLGAAPTTKNSRDELYVLDLRSEERRVGKERRSVVTP